MKKQDVTDRANEMIRQHGEVTVRQIYYQLYPKHHSDYKNANSFYSSFDRMLVDTRESGEVNPTRVIDTARDTRGGDYGATDPESWLHSRVSRFLEAPDYYSRKRWGNQPVKPIIWIEKDALSRIVGDVADEYNVKTCPSRGYSSLHYLWKIVKNHDGIKFLHFADHDPSGLDMTTDLKARARKYAEEEIPVERIGLTIDQVREFNLAPNPTKKADSRADQYIERFGDRCWELDALPPAELKRLVRKAIEDEIDQGKWEETERREEKEREELKKEFEKFEEAIKKSSSE